MNSETANLGKVFFSVYKIKIRKEHYLGILVGLLGLFIGLDKLSRIQSKDMSISWHWTLLICLLCILFSSYQYLNSHKKIDFSKVLKVYTIIVPATVVFFFFFNYDLAGLLFISFLSVCMGNWIYHIHLRG